MQYAIHDGEIHLVLTPDELWSLAGACSRGTRGRWPISQQVGEVLMHAHEQDVIDRTPHESVIDPLVEIPVKRDPDTGLVRRAW